MSEFGNAKKIQSLVREQLVAGAQSAFALLLSNHPSIDLMAIANADGDVRHIFCQGSYSFYHCNRQAGTEFKGD
jgi:hypothetical protein